MNNQIVVLVSIAVAVPVVFSCCIPDQWQGLQGFALGQVKEGKPSLIEALFNVSYDAIGRKIFLAGSLKVDGKPINEVILQDYANGHQYVVIHGKCTKSKLTMPFPPSCTPSDAKKVLSSFFGAGNNKINIEIYNYKDMGKETSFTVTKGSCIPLMMFQKSDDSILVNNYFGTTLGIMNMTVFDVPKACMNPVHVSPKMHQADHRRAVFIQ